MPHPQPLVLVFLSQPFSSWQSSLLYMSLCLLLLSVLGFITKHYIDLVRHRSGRHIQYQAKDPLTYSLPTSQHVYPRTPYPRSPLFHVSSPSDDSSDEAREVTEDVMKTRIPLKPARRNWVFVGSVNESHIAKRRRVSSPKND